MEMELPSSLHADGDGARRRLREYLLALEEERRKIHVFQRELPLCLNLVTQTMEAMRSQLMDGLASEEETVSDHGPPVLEEFIPLKPSLSLCSSDDQSTHTIPPVAKQDEAETERRMMPDWLHSVQLNWSHQSSNTTKELPCKPVATKAWGAFHPFDKNKRAAEAEPEAEPEPEPEVPAASSTTAPASSASAVVGDSGDKATSEDTEMHRHKEDILEKDKEDKEPKRKARRCWAPELHRLFLQALQQLGGSHVATPKQIRELMKVDGLTNDEVKSHLQKYRLHTSRRPSSTTQSSGGATATQPAPQFVLVGSCIWVPQQEYAAAAAQPQAAKPTNVASGSARQVYAPVATLPSRLQPHSEKKQSSLESQGRIRSGNNTATGDASSDSPAVSSSSQTTSP